MTRTPNSECAIMYHRFPQGVSPANDYLPDNTGHTRADAYLTLIKPFCAYVPWLSPRPLAPALAPLSRCGRRMHAVPPRTARAYAARAPVWLAAAWACRL